jgi:hypothetical protein
MSFVFQSKKSNAVKKNLQKNRQHPVFFIHHESGSRKIVDWFLVSLFGQRRDKMTSSHYKAASLDSFARPHRLRIRENISAQNRPADETGVAEYRKALVARP